MDDRRNVRLDFKAVDTVRLERLVLDISGIDNEQDLLDSLHLSVETALDGADGRSVVLRTALAGRGDLHGGLKQPNFIQDLTDGLNGQWAQRSPFAWCERIQDRTLAPFNRQERIEGTDFLAEVLKTADRAKQDPTVLAGMQDRFSDLYQHHRYRRHLVDQESSEEDLASLIDEAESIVADLLAGDNT